MTAPTTPPIEIIPIKKTSVTINKKKKEKYPLILNNHFAPRCNCSMIFNKLLNLKTFVFKAFKQTLKTQLLLVNNKLGN